MFSRTSRTASQKKHVEDARKRGEDKDRDAQIEDFLHNARPSPSIARPSPVFSAVDDGRDDPYSNWESTSHHQRHMSGSSRISTNPTSGEPEQGEPHRPGDEFEPVARPEPLRRAPTRHPRGRHTRRSSLNVRDETIELQPYPVSLNPPQRQGQGGLRTAEPYNPRRMQYQPQPQPRQLSRATRSRAGGDDMGGCECCGDCE